MARTEEAGMKTNASTDKTMDTCKTWCGDQTCLREGCLALEQSVQQHKRRQEEDLPAGDPGFYDNVGDWGD
jgi:hypothetical protein